MTKGSNPSKVTVAGTGSPSYAVSVFLCTTTPCSESNDTEVMTLNVAGNGKWSETGADNGTGTWYSSASQTDVAGNTGTSATFGPFTR
jgi:hypothetical protein